MRPYNRGEELMTLRSFLEKQLDPSDDLIVMRADDDNTYAVFNFTLECSNEDVKNILKFIMNNALLMESLKDWNIRTAIPKEGMS